MASTTFPNRMPYQIYQPLPKTHDRPKPEKSAPQNASEEGNLLLASLGLSSFRAGLSSNL